MLDLALIVSRAPGSSGAGSLKDRRHVARVLEGTDEERLSGDAERRAQQDFAGVLVTSNDRFAVGTAQNDIPVRVHRTRNFSLSSHSQE